MARILIVDDDPDMVESMRVVLESRDYSVTSAKSGQEGLKIAKLEKPDLIILDVMMETMDKGFDVARELKKDKNCKDTPILMLTAIKDKIGLDFKNEAGDEAWLPVDDYVEKPLKPEELVAKVDLLLKGR
ncbi:MAG: response regulator [Candidatus Omnitrophota bacterium]